MHPESSFLCSDWIVADPCSQFGMTYYFNDWAVRDGYVPPVMLMLSMTTGITLIGMVLLMFYGKKCRRLTQHSKVHQF